MAAASSQLSQGVEATFRLSASVLFPIQELSEKLKEMQNQFPETDLHLCMEVLSGEALLHRDETDMAIIEHVEDIQFLEVKPLMKVKMPVMVSANHYLTKFKGLVPRSELLQFPQIVLSTTQLCKLHFRSR